MKKFFVLALLVLSFNSQAQAWFRVNVRVYASPVQLTAYVDNMWGRPMLCRGNVAGITYQGPVAYAYFNNIVVYPGMFAQAYAYTNNYNPFVRYTSNVYCAWY